VRTEIFPLQQPKPLGGFTDDEAFSWWRANNLGGIKLISRRSGKEGRKTRAQLELCCGCSQYIGSFSAEAAGRLLGCSICVGGPSCGVSPAIKRPWLASNVYLPSKLQYGNGQFPQVLWCIERKAERSRSMGNGKLTVKKKKLQSLTEEAD
jgi:hypothetical protein